MPKGVEHKEPTEPFESLGWGIDPATDAFDAVFEAKTFARENVGVIAAALIKTINTDSLLGENLAELGSRIVQETRRELIVRYLEDYLGHDHPTTVAHRGGLEGELVCNSGNTVRAEGELVCNCGNTVRAHTVHIEEADTEVRSYYLCGACKTKHYTGRSSSSSFPKSGQLT